MKHYFLAIVLFLSVFYFPGCQKNTPANPIYIEPPTAGWEKVNISDVLPYCSFDSQNNLYFVDLHDNILRADANFHITDTLKAPFRKNYEYPFKIHITNNGVIIVSLHNGMNESILVSQDKGLTWNRPTTFWSTSITDIFSKESRIYISSFAHDESTSMVQLSEDNGITWKRMAIDLSFYTSFDFCRENNNHEIFYFKKGSLYYSNNYGLSSSAFTNNLINYWTASFAFGPDKNLVLAGGNGIFLSTDFGINWSTVIPNNKPGYYYSVHNSTEGIIYALYGHYEDYNKCSLTDFLISRDGGVTWNSFLPPLPGNCMDSYCIYGKDNRLYAVTQVNNQWLLYRSTIKL